MDWLSFISNIVRSLAWPSVVIALTLILRRPISDLFPLLQRLKYKDLELEFGKRVEDVKEELAQGPAAGVGLGTEQSEAIRQLADVSPRAAVLEAWREVELAALNAAQKISGETFPYKTLTYQALRFLEHSQSLDRNVISVMRDLRALRNQAAHAPQFALTKESAIGYASSAFVVARYFRKLNAGKVDS